MMVGFAPWENEGRVVKTIPGYYWPIILDHLHQRVHMLDHVHFRYHGNRQEFSSHSQGSSLKLKLYFVYLIDFANPQNTGFLGCCCCQRRGLRSLLGYREAPVCVGLSSQGARTQTPTRSAEVKQSSKIQRSMWFRRGLLS